MKPHHRPTLKSHLQGFTIAVVVLGSLTANLSATPIEPGEIRVPDATEVRLRLEHPISSASAFENQAVIFQVVDDVVLDGRTVVARGAQALGTVTRAQRRKGFGRRGKLEFEISVVEAVDGQKLRLNANQSLRGKDQFGAAGVVTILTGPFGIFVKGKDIEVPAGTEFTVYTDGERQVQAKGDRRHDP